MATPKNTTKQTATTANATVNGTAPVNDKLSGAEISAILDERFAGSGIDWRAHSDGLRFDGQKNQQGYPIVYASLWRDGTKISGVRCSINTKDKLFIQMQYAKVPDSPINKTDVAILQHLYDTNGKKSVSAVKTDYV